MQVLMHTNILTQIHLHCSYFTYYLHYMLILNLYYHVYWLRTLIHASAL